MEKPTAKRERTLKELYESPHRPKFSKVMELQELKGLKNEAKVSEFWLDRYNQTVLFLIEYHSIEQSKQLN